MGLEEGGPRGGTTSLLGGGLAGPATAARTPGFPRQDRPSGWGRVQDAALLSPRTRLLPPPKLQSEGSRWLLGPPAPRSPSDGS